MDNISYIKGQYPKFTNYFIINGDFNAIHDQWSNDIIRNPNGEAAKRGDIVAHWIVHNQYRIGNNGDNTYIAPNGKESAIDLTLGIK